MAAFMYLPEALGGNYGLEQQDVAGQFGVWGTRPAPERPRTRRCRWPLPLSWWPADWMCCRETSVLVPAGELAKRTRRLSRLVNKVFLCAALSLLMFQLDLDGQRVLPLRTSRFVG